MQWLGFTIGSIVPFPLIVSAAFGLNPAETAAFFQRSILFCGLFSFLQVYFGHRLPLLEGPSGIWIAVTSSVAASAIALGQSAHAAMGSFSLAMIICGLLIILISVFGFSAKLGKFVSPMILGTALIMLSLQFGTSCLVNMLGLTGGGFDAFGAIVSLLVLLIIVVIKVKVKGFVGSISILIGLIFGYLVYLAFGKVSFQTGVSTQFYIPAPFELGAPSFDTGILIGQVVVVFVTFMLSIAGIKGMAESTGMPADKKQLNRGILLNGISTLFGGIFTSVGTTPLNSCIGFVELTGVASRRVFAVSMALFAALGLFPPVSAVLVSIPLPVLYTIFFVISASLMGMGLKEYARLEMNTNHAICVGFSLMAGVSVLVLPADTLAFLPDWCEYVFQNGMATAIIVCLVMEGFFKLIDTKKAQ